MLYIATRERKGSRGSIWIEKKQKRGKSQKKGRKKDAHETKTSKLERKERAQENGDKPVSTLAD